MECPYCGKKIENACTHCRFCGQFILEKNPSISAFLTKNASLLAAIGLIGTMISLMPNFAEKMSNEIWLSNLSNYQISVLFLSIQAGLILIFILFVEMILRFFKGKVELAFGLLLTMFIVFLTSFCLFIFFSVQKYIFVQILLICFYIIIVISIVIGSKSETRKSKSIAMATLIFIVVLIGINLLILVLAPHPSFIEPNQNNTKIEYDVSYYTPTIPQSIGIGMSPKIDGTITPNYYNFTWRTNYGYFVAVDPANNRVKYLGNVSTNHGEKIYWSYNVKDEILSKPTITISLQIQKPENEYLFNSSIDLTRSNSELITVIIPNN